MYTDCMSFKVGVYVNNVLLCYYVTMVTCEPSSPISPLGPASPACPYNGPKIIINDPVHIYMFTFVIYLIILFTPTHENVKDGAYFCYYVSVLRNLRYSDFLWVVPTNTRIFLRGLKLCGESRT